MTQQALVIGSGIAGIAAALRLRHKGMEVTIFEANSYPGGKLSSIQLGNYRFDTGPSLFTLPKLVEELFELFGERPEDHFRYIRLKMLCHYFFEDGTRIRAWSDRQHFLSEVRNVLKIDTDPLEKHLDESAYIYEQTKRSFLEKSLHSWRTYASKDLLKTITAIPNLHLFKSMHQVNQKTLNHPKLVQLFDRYATYNGSDPYQAPGVLNSIPHLEFGIGAFFPTEGMHSITESLVALAKRQGVRFRFGEKVTQIVCKSCRVAGIRTTSGFHPASVIISNSDVRKSYDELLPEQRIPTKIRKQEPSSSALIFYWGIKQSFPELDVHNILFSENYQQEFEAIFKKQTIATDPTVYIHISSKVVVKDAPENGENWFVMVNVPADYGQDWEQLRQQTRKYVIDKINRHLKTDLEALIEEEDYLDPLRIESRTNSYAGALYGASSNDRMAAFFRQSNKSNIKGLYFVGGSVHPGGGIPLCLLSAKIASNWIP